MKTMDKRKAPRYECCGMSFPSSQLLGSHVATCHHDGLICVKCNQSFNTPAKLRKHQIIHFGKKEFVCKICNFATVHKYNAKRHLESHERTGNSRPRKRTLVCQSRSIGKSKKNAKSLIHRSRKAGNRTSTSEKIESSDSDNFTAEKQRKQYDEKHKTTKDRRASLCTVQNHGKADNRTKEDKSLNSIEANVAEKIGNNSATVDVGVDKQLLKSPRLLGQKRNSPLAVGHIAHVNELIPISGLAASADLPTDSIQDEARQIKSRMSVITAIPALLPLLERLLELLAIVATRIPKSMAKNVRFKAVECLEYLLNTLRMSIIRWEDLIGRTAHDPAFSAIVYVYGTLPVFVNWERHEHLEMLENIILLILNTVKHRQSPQSTQSQVKSKVDQGW